MNDKTAASTDRLFELRQRKNFLNIILSSDRKGKLSVINSQ